MMVEQKAAEAIERFDMLRSDSRIVVGVSGGADSVCLLHYLAELAQNRQPKVRLRAVHVHHGLRKTADRDAEYVQEVCRSLSIPLALVRADAAAEAFRRGMTVEEAGRELRYEALETACRKWAAEEPAGAGGLSSFSIATAHHMEDCAETVLFNLCRGSSLAGLAGIHPVSERHGIRIIRPLITSTRDEIEEFLFSRGVAWCSDETNADERITRNFIRRRILPELTAHVNSAAAAHIVRTAENVGEAEEFLRTQTQKAVEMVRDGDPVGDGNGCMEWYSVSKLGVLSDFMQRRVLYQVLTEAAGKRKDIAETHIDSLQRLLKSGGSAALDLPYGIRAVKEYDRLYFLRKAMDAEPEIAAAPEPGKTNGILPEKDSFAAGYPVDSSCYAVRRLQFSGDSADIPTDPDTKWVDYDRINRSVQFRTRQPGDVIILDSDGHGKKLSRAMIDLHIAERIRDDIVLPMNGNRVIWFPGYRIGADCRVTSDTGQILEIRLNKSR